MIPMIHPALAAVAQSRPPNPPGYCPPTFTLMPVGSTSLRKFRALTILAASPPQCRLLSASCSSGQRFTFGFLQIRSRSRHPCRSANSSPCRASRGLPPPSECALPGAPKRKPRCQKNSRVRFSLLLTQSQLMGDPIFPR